jgi:hypothetical protein
MEGFGMSVRSSVREPEKIVAAGGAPAASEPQEELSGSRRAGGWALYRIGGEPGGVGACLLRPPKIQTNDATFVCHIARWPFAFLFPAVFPLWIKPITHFRFVCPRRVSGLWQRDLRHDNGLKTLSIIAISCFWSASLEAM